MVALVGSTSIGGFWPVSSSIMQLTTTPEMRGRMMALMQFAPVFHFLGAVAPYLACSSYMAGRWPSAAPPRYCWLYRSPVGSTAPWCAA